MLPRAKNVNANRALRPKRSISLGNRSVFDWLLHDASVTQNKRPADRSLERTAETQRAPRSRICWGEADLAHGAVAPIRSWNGARRRASPRATKLAHQNQISGSASSAVPKIPAVVVWFSGSHSCDRWGPGPTAPLNGALRIRAFVCGFCRWLALGAGGCVRATGCTCRRSP